MTLVDSSEAIVFSALETIKEFHGDSNVSSKELKQFVGLPMRKSLELWIDPQVAASAFEFYKKFYLENAIHLTFAIPGAREILAQLTLDNIPHCVITAKDEKVAKNQLSYLNFPKSTIFGGRFREEKTKAMLEFECTHYVGDHLEDYKSAMKAGVTFIGLDFNVDHNLRSKIPQESKVFSGLFDILEHLKSLYSPKERNI
jgi:phosphoglycolate phosphatase-like HAD superfamily hydrolase